MKKLKKIVIILLLTILFPLFSDDKLPSTNNIIRAEQIERQETELKAKLLIKEAHDSYINKDYSKAKDQYLKVIAILTQTSSLQENNNKIEQIKNSISQVYTSWAEETVKDAKKQADLGKIDEAIQLCKEAAKMNPGIKPYADSLIKKFQKQQLVTEYKINTDEDIFNPKYNDTKYQIDVLYEQGKTLFNNGLYDKAKDKFENILVIDPYNSKAIFYLKRINNKIFQSGETRTKRTVIDRMGEVEWNSVTPINIKSSEYNDNNIGNTPILKEDELASIKSKLNDIVIQHIAFEEVPITTAILFLKRESKKLDPEGKGVNFFLRLEPSSESTEQTVEPSEEDEDSGFLNWTGNEPEGGTAENLMAEQYLITLVLNNIPLIKAIEYICDAAGLKYRVRKFAIEIASEEIAFDDLVTKVFPVENYIFGTEFDITTNEQVASINVLPFFTSRGIVSYPDASALFDSKISRLIVRNTPEEIDKIQKIVSQMNSTFSQVSINAKFVEMQQTDFDELGFQWKFSREDTSEKISWQQNDQLNRYFGTYDSTDPQYVPDREFGFSVQQNGIQLDGIMHALNQNQNVEILSSPKILTLDGHRAVIRMIREDYYANSWTEPEYTRDSGVGGDIYTPPTPSDFLEWNLGIEFSVVPYVSSDQYTIDLELEPKITEFVGWDEYEYTVQAITDAEASGADISQPVIKMPIIAARSVQTQVRIYDGETVVMGGVLIDETDNTDDRVPIIGDIPLVGRFFRSQAEDVKKTNLLIFTNVKLVKADGTPLRPENNQGLPSFDE